MGKVGETKMSAGPSSRLGASYGYTSSPRHCPDAIRGAIARHEASHGFTTLGQAVGATNTTQMKYDQAAARTISAISPLDPGVVQLGASDGYLSRQGQYGVQCGRLSYRPAPYPTMPTYGIQTHFNPTAHHCPTPSQATCQHDVWGDRVGYFADGVTRLSPGVARYCSRR